MSQRPNPHRLLGPDASHGIVAALTQHMPAKRILLVCDGNTWSAAGAAIDARLADGYTTRVMMQPPPVRPTMERAREIAAAANDYDALLAIGSGVINDLTKYAAHIANKPYAVVATAATMNGYTSANVSIDENGHKRSHAATPPRFVIGDTTILAAAPKRLTRAGLGDTLCRSTVEADMLMSHWLLGTPYPAELFARLRHHEATLFTGTMNARGGEGAFLTTLFEALLDAGDAMAEYGSSAPASQGEHMIAHALELKYASEMYGTMHGELIAITTMTMALLQQRLLLSVPIVKSLVYEPESFSRHFGRQHAEALAASYHEKLLTPERAAEVNARIDQHWPEIKQALEAIMVTPNTLERAFIHSGLSTKPAQIGLIDERYRFATSYAHLTRDRFTFLDLAAMGTKRAA